METSYVTSPKPLTLVTLSAFSNLPWLLWSYSPWVTWSPLTVHMQMTPLFRPSSWAACPTPNCLQDKWYLRDIINQRFQNGTHHILLPPCHQPNALCPWDFVGAESSAWRVFLFPLTLWPLHLIVIQPLGPRLDVAPSGKPALNPHVWVRYYYDFGSSHASYFIKSSILLIIICTPWRQGSFSLVHYILWPA